MVEKPPKFDVMHGSKNYVVQSPSLKRMLNSINEEYLYWDKVKYKDSKLPATELWQLVKFSRLMKSSPLQFGKNQFHFVMTDYVQKMMHYFDMNVGGLLASKSVVPEEDKTRYLVSSIMEEAISSSQIEGANTTRKRAKEMLRKEIKPQTKSEIMIVNNYRSIKHITEHKTEELTAEKLLEIHSLIARDTFENPSEVGQFRSDDQIFVVDHTKSEVVYTPPSHTLIAGLINELCNFFNQDDDEKFIHPLLKGIILHFMIGWIHPFADGNGRTARAIFYWYLLKRGYWLTEYLSISKIINDSKSQYERAFIYTENDENDLTYFITYNLRVMEKAFIALKRYIGLKQKENLQVAQFVRLKNVNERQAQLLKLVFDQAEIVFNIKEVENRFSVSNYTARMDLKGLVKLGFLEMVAVNKVKRNFIKSKQFDEMMKAMLNKDNVRM